MKIISVKSYEELSRKAAEILAAHIIVQPELVLGLATGDTPAGTYQKLIEKYNEGALDFSHVKTVNLDEYVGLASTHPQSYRYFMEKHLFEYININAENTYLPDGTSDDLDKACTLYNSIIRSLGGIDVQLLGIGRNGHIGFNEPGTAFETKTHVVDLSQDTIRANSRLFERIEDVPKRAITMGIGNIMQAKNILLIVNGEAKADAVVSAFYGPVVPTVPASILQLHPNVTVVADEAALSKVPGSRLK